MEIGTHGILEVQIPNLDLDFWNSNPKIHFFWQIWGEKIKVVQFGWKLAHRMSRRCWFSFGHYFSQFRTLNPFLDKFGLKKSKLFVLPENWHTCTYTHSISKMLILISILVFWNSKPKSIFWTNLSQKIRILHFAWKLVDKVFWGCDCMNKEQGLEEKIKMNNYIKCFVALVSLS